MIDIISSKIVTNRKPCRCNACWRMFPKGAQMTKQVCKYNDIYVFATCATCQALLTSFKEHFADIDDVCYEMCVLNRLGKAQTPEDLLQILMIKVLKE